MSYLLNFLYTFSRQTAPKTKAATIKNIVMLTVYTLCPRTQAPC